MSEPKTSFTLLLASFLSLSIGTARAAGPGTEASAPAFTERAAVEAAIAKNPALRAAVVDVQASAAQVRAEDARYRPTLTVDAAFARDATPSLSAAGGTTTTTQQGFIAGATLGQTFSGGTAVALRLEGRHTTTEGALGGTGDAITLGPGEGLTAKLSVTQPLLRGRGDDVGLAQLRAALLAKKERERARDATASETLSTVLQAYWELWYAEKALDIEVSARTLAEGQRDEVKRKVAQGSAAPVDVLPYDTRLAERAQAVLAAEVQVERRTIELLRAMGDDRAAAALDVSAAEPQAPQVEVTRERAVAAAEEASYAVRALAVSLETAEDALRTAGEPTRPRLDLVGSVSAQGLGDRALGPALEQLGGLDAVSANVGLVLELPLSSVRHDAERTAAELAVKGARERLEAARQQVRAQASTEHATLARAARNIGLALQTAEVSRASVAAQAERLRVGSATGIEVREAEDSLRRAELAVERAKVDAVTAELRLAHLTGELLARWGASDVAPR